MRAARGIVVHIAALGVLGCVYLAMPAAAVELAAIEGAARGYPAMRNLDGKTIANGDFAQWLDGGRLHVKIVYTSSEGRRIEEQTVFRQQPELIQEIWSWRELRQGQLLRQFDVNFSSGRAVAKKREKEEMKEWSEELEIEPGRTFAGFGFTLALKGLRTRLVRGEHAELRAVGFTPKPKAVGVDVSFAGLDWMSMSGRVIRGDHFVIHPKIPWFAEPFVDVPDTHIWLTNPTPAAFLRWEGPLAEPGDQAIRVDLLPGGPSGPAAPVKRPPRTTTSDSRR
jgi:hypothetical protein